MSLTDEILKQLVKGEVYVPVLNYERRAAELAEDCQELGRRLSRLATRLKDELDKLASGVASLYPNPDQAPPEAKPIEVKFSQWIIPLPALAAPIGATPFVTTALSIASVCYLVDAGKGGASSLEDLLGLPESPKVETATEDGGLLVSLNAGPLGDSGIEDRLKEAIRGGLAARAQLAAAYAVGSRLADRARSAGQFPSLAGYAPADKIIEGLTSYAKKAAGEIAVSDKDIESYLAAFAAARRSWTEGDAG